MPLSVDNVIHENTGTTATGTSHVVSLAGADSTTAGNTVMVFMAAPGSAPTPPAGFVTVKSNAGGHFVMVKSDVAASETSWTFTTVGSITTTWYVVEMSNVDLVEPLDASVSNFASVGNGGTLSTGTTGLNAGLSTVAYAMFGGDATHTSSSWDSYTNGLVEVADVAATGSTRGLAVARKFVDGSTGTFESTATLTTSSGAASTYATMVVFRSADSPIVAPLAHFVGMEWGTHGGAASHNGSTNMFGGPLTPIGGTWGTNYLVQAGSARNSNYGLRIVHSSSSCYVPTGSFTTKQMAFGMDVRVVSATGTVIVADTNTAQLLYDASATKFGVRCGSTGTTSWQSGTTALNTWVWVDVRVKTSTSTWHAEWRIETGTDTYTDQASADLTGQSPANMSYLLVGSGTAQTMTADYDNIVISTYYVAYPLGPQNVKLLTVDPAGTPTLSGTSTNFSVFTANGTLGAWNAANARNAVDEVPPDVSATADGVVQTAVAASDYIEFPMATYTLAANEFVNGVRMMCPAWGGTGSGTGTLGIRGWDGTAETTLIDAVTSYDAGSPTAYSSTEPRWQCADWLSTNGWTQAELNAAAIRVGFSTDATPDMGVHAVYLEVAVGKTRTQQLFGSMASIEQDPTRLGAVSVTLAAPAAGADSSLYYEQGGSPTTVPVTGGTSTTQQLNAAFADETNYVAAYWPPEGVPDA